MMFIHARCNNAGPLGKPIRTHSVVTALLTRLPVLNRLRW